MPDMTIEELIEIFDDMPTVHLRADYDEAFIAKAAILTVLCEFKQRRKDMADTISGDLAFLIQRCTKENETLKARVKELESLNTMKDVNSLADVLAEGREVFGADNDTTLPDD